MFLRYNELRVLMANPEAFDARSLVSRSPGRARARVTRSGRPTGSARRPRRQLDFPYYTLWGFPEKFYREPPQRRPATSRASPRRPGSRRGRARYVGSLDEFDQVQKGEILVCQMTNPAWVVLFTKIAGLVTDAGGVASHPAVVAREFGIPAVVGTSNATERIKTGDRVRVNGATGVVEILGVDRRRAARSLPRAGQGCAPRAHLSSGDYAARRPPRRDPDRAGARHEPGARAGGAARARGPALRRDRSRFAAPASGPSRRSSSPRSTRCAQRSRSSLLARRPAASTAMSRSSRTSSRHAGGGRRDGDLRRQVEHDVAFHRDDRRGGRQPDPARRLDVSLRVEARTMVTAREDAHRPTTSSPRRTMPVLAALAERRSASAAAAASRRHFEAFGELVLEAGARDPARRPVHARPPRHADLPARPASDAAPLRELDRSSRSGSAQRSTAPTRSPPATSSSRTTTSARTATRSSTSAALTPRASRASRSSTASPTASSSTSGQGIRLPDHRRGNRRGARGDRLHAQGARHRPHPHGRGRVQHRGALPDRPLRDDRRGDAAPDRAGRAPDGHRRDHVRSAGLGDVRGQALLGGAPRHDRRGLLAPREPA